MKEPLRVLLVEDISADAELVIIELKLAGFDPIWKRVDKEADYVASLDPSLDIILSDYYLPQFSALRALQLLQASDLDIPFIVVSGAIDEETAVECIKQGAVDYLLKDRLTRLGHCVRSALQEKRMRAEQLKAMKTLEYQAYLLANVSDAIVATDTEFKITAWNHGAEQVFGWTQDQVLGKYLPDLTQPNFGSITFDALKQQLLKQGYWAGEVIERHKSGAWIDVQVSMKTLYDEHGTVIGAVSVNRDITERKRVEQSLRESAEQYQTIVSTTTDGFWITDGNGKILDVNETYCRMSGYSRAELLTMSIQDIEAQESPDQVLEHTRKILQSGSTRFESRHRCKDGRLIDLEISVAHMPETKQLFSFMHDITERKRAAEEIRQLKEFNERIVRSMQEGIVIQDEEGNFTFCNPAAENILGYTLDELLGKPWTLVVPPDQQSIVRAADARHKLGVADRYEVEIVRKDGTRIPMLVSGNPILEDGHWAGTMTTFSDIAEHKKHERELETLNRISTALRAASIRAEMPPVLLQELMPLFNADSATLILLDPQTNECFHELAVGEWARMTDRRIPAGKGVSAHVLKTGQPYVTNDLPNDPNFYWRDMIGNSRAFAAAPLIAQGETFGLLAIKRTVPFLDEDVRLLVSVAEITCSAMNRASLHEQTEQRLEQLTALRTIDRAINASLDLKIILNVLLDQVILQLHADAADILLFNPYLQTLDYTYGHGFRTRAVERTSMRIGTGYAGRALIEHRIVSASDATHGDDFSRGASFTQEGFVTCHAVPLFVKGNPKGVLEVFHRTAQNPDAEWLSFLESLAGQAAIALDNAQLFEELQRSNANLALAYDATIEGWSRALDLRDHETEGHTVRVTEMTLRLAQAMHFSGEALVHVRRGALLHDIGKMGVPDGILRKPGALTPEEWQIMRCHPIYAHDLLLPIEYLHPAIDIPYCHHEKWDGSGYPRGLSGEQIPLAARIFAIVDVWDAIRSDRPYRPAWSEEKARRHILAESGKHFDPRVVQMFMVMLDQGM